MTSKRVIFCCVAVAALFLIPYLLASSATAATCVTVEPIPGLPELPVDVDECPTPDPAPSALCKGRAFPWYGECWNRHEGQAFARALREHGASPHAFKRRHPQLARIFGRHWPGPNWLRLDRDFAGAVGYSAGRFGVSAAWMTACARSEGGTTPGHITIGSAGEHGWWQYLPGTWDWMSGSAFTYRGSPPGRYKHRDSLLGQAWTTAWAFSRGLSYHWYGSGC